ncbi:MAG TPA: hypothetical protein VFC79_03775 [Tissierellaceae bacterium]|nr:hypothetical protein [Tissierellaceae bacterium]
MTKTRGFEVVSKYKDKGINLPKRATRYSAGYDMESAEDIVIPSIWKSFFKGLFTYFSKEKGWDDYKEVIAKSIKPTLVPTGLKAYMQEGEVLKLFNRSSNPLKLGLILSNGTGILDKDYYNNPDNEGLIYAQFINIFPYDIQVKKGQRICQGIFEQFLIADNDNAEGERKGGHGSTN